MQTNISLLRGINVSGRNKIPMMELKAMYEASGFTAVRTYIQSGNVVFQSRGSGKLAGTIAGKIKETFGFEVPVVIRTAAEMEQIVHGNPMMGEPGITAEHLHVTLLSDTPDAALVSRIPADIYAPDRFLVKGKEIYLYCPGGYGNTKLTNGFFEKKLQVTATTRNWKTMNELLKMATAAAG